MLITTADRLRRCLNPLRACWNRFELKIDSPTRRLLSETPLERMDALFTAIDFHIGCLDLAEIAEDSVAIGRNADGLRALLERLLPTCEGIRQELAANDWRPEQKLCGKRMHTRRAVRSLPSSLAAYGSLTGRRRVLTAEERTRLKHRLNTASRAIAKYQALQAGATDASEAG
jgi:hypothetical protein